MKETATLTLYDYQQEIVSKAYDILMQNKFVYLAMEMRTGKTLTALRLLELTGAKKILFITKKKAIQSIIADAMLLPNLDIDVVNYEILHKVINTYDAVVLDEAHCLGAFPQPSLRVKRLKKYLFVSKVKYVVFLSGTPFPESYSQVYHQFFVLPYQTPFSEYRNFYHWASDFVSIREKHLPHAVVKDYSVADKNKINQLILPYIITCTQKEAWGKEVQIMSEIIQVNMRSETHSYINELLRDGIIRKLNYVAENAAKEFTALHQLSSGTLKNGDEYLIIDESKINALKEILKLFRKVVVFYKFIAEKKLLDKYFLFNENVVPLQLQSGSEGFAVEDADTIVYLNVDFSNRTHLQSRQRITFRGRGKVIIFYLVSDYGFERNVLKVLSRKEKYNIKDFYEFKREKNTR